MLVIISINANGKLTTDILLILGYLLVVINHNYPNNAGITENNIINNPCIVSITLVGVMHSLLRVLYSADVSMSIRINRLIHGTS